MVWLALRTTNLDFESAEPKGSGLFTVSLVARGTAALGLSIYTGT